MLTISLYFVLLLLAPDEPTVTNCFYPLVKLMQGISVSAIGSVAYTAAPCRRICGSGSSVPVHKALAYTSHFIIDNFSAQ